MSSGDIWEDAGKNYRRNFFEDDPQIVETPNDVHAGEFDTSMSLAVRLHLVYRDLAERSIPEFSSRYLDFTGKRGIAWYAYTRKISTSGS